MQAKRLLLWAVQKLQSIEEDARNDALKGAKKAFARVRSLVPFFS